MVKLKKFFKMIEREITNLEQLTRSLSPDSLILKFMSRILKQFGGEIEIEPEVVEIIRRFGADGLSGQQKAELFRLLTVNNGSPSTHLSNQLARTPGKDRKKDSNRKPCRRNRRKWH